MEHLKKSQVLVANATIVKNRRKGIPLSEYFNSTDNHKTKPMKLRKEDDQHEDRAFVGGRDDCLYHSQPTRSSVYEVKPREYENSARQDI